MQKLQKRHYEHHLHLYGCLTAEDVWELGKDIWQERRSRLEWYARTYFACFGIPISYASFWQKDDGFSLLRASYEISSPVSFAQFQAKFNLLIALFPFASAETPVVWERVVARHLDSALRYAEYRTLFPPAPISPASHFQQLNTLLARYETASGSSFQPRFAVSMSRCPDTAMQQYLQLRQLLDEGELSHLTAVDFCGFEEDHPPSIYQRLFVRINADNQQNTRKLAILLHVGETFVQTSICSAIRWVLQAHALGVHRLGHALALGIDVESLRLTRMREAKQERFAHLRWLATEPLREYGYISDTSLLRKEICALEETNATHVDIYYDDARLAQAQALQVAALRFAHDNKLLIESCPTSNRFLGRIESLAHHPLLQFSRHALAITLASDDPGMFATNHQQERKFCVEQLQISDDFMRRVDATQADFCSEKLAQEQ